MLFFRARRRLRQEIKGLKYVIGARRSMKIIKFSFVAYQVSRVLYNPFYLIEIAKKEILKNLI
jgi:hypothetical protein